MDEIILYGYLVIYVDGYKYNYKRKIHILKKGDLVISVPDRFVLPSLNEIDSMEWWQEGWAVGDNAYDRFCRRVGSKPLKKFYSYDEAVSYAFNRQKKNKKQQFVLVYVTKDGMSREQKNVIRSLDDIAAVNARNDEERQNIAIEKARLADEKKARYHELDQLKQKYGLMKSWKLADTLADLREKGLETVQASMSKSSWYRFVRELREAGIEFQK